MKFVEEISILKQTFADEKTKLVDVISNQSRLLEEKDLTIR